MALEKYFEPEKHERQIYRRWETSGAFRADASSERPPFVISMPPPNATGTLHLGHAVMLALEDVLIRWRRMAGDEALWVPGTDHAAIATESLVIRQLRDSGMADPRQELGREGLVARIAEFVESSRHRIREQIRAMGSSCDWSRERYTMEPTLSRCVNGVFARMFRDGLIYRGPRIVNWDPYLRTTVSDDEIYHEERPAKFYTLRYGPFLVGTSRPETKLGDTAVAVHPEDPRWREHVGQTYEVPWPRGPVISVRVVADESVDPETGTGALGVTPAHSQVDFEIAERHNLPLIQVIGEDGRMTAAAGEHYAGMTVEDCREAFVQELEAAGLLAKVEDYSQPTSLCYRSKKPIEPLPKQQWFIDVNRPSVPWQGRMLSLRQILREVVESGQIRLVPEHQEKTYFHWIDNLRDWCISRQIWWGHRIPVWYRGEEDLYVGHRPPAGDDWEQDPDTLDTWFSSALWTWSTLVDRELAADPSLSLRQLVAASPEVARFHPTQVMETGYDILFFWVARMILMTTYSLEEVPFEVVYLHGLVLDKDGDKMSKSKPDTCIDPLETVAEFGADALRLSLLVGNAPGKDFKLGKERIVGSKRLINKIWNAAKLVQRICSADTPELDPRAVRHPVNRWLLTRVWSLTERVDQRLGEYHFGDATEHIRASFWGELCDVYLEAIKVPELAQAAETAAVLRASFATYLKLYHPFIPFVTEHLWEHLGFAGMLIHAPWPRVEERGDWSAEVAGVEAVVRAIAAVRGIRAEQGLEPGAKIEVELLPKEHREVFAACEPFVARLVRAEGLRTVDALGNAGDAAVAVDPAFEVAVRLGQADRQAEEKRLRKQLEQARQHLAGTEKRLQNPDFVQRAKPIAVEKAREQAAKLGETIASLEERLAAFE